MARTKAGGARRKARQGELAFKRRGGARRGAGRKPKGARAGVSHAARAPLASRHPVHVTLRLREGLPSLRRKTTYRVVRRAFAAGCDRFGFRLVQYSVQTNHVHLVAEARDRRALTRGVQGLAIRIAKGLNRLWRRAGKVFGDRYHDRILRTPREVRNVLAYVLHNARRHGARLLGVDPFSSGPWFDGWREGTWSDAAGQRAPPVAEARTWLLSLGWRRHGRISIEERPGPRNPAATRGLNGA